MKIRNTSKIFLLFITCLFTTIYANKQRIKICIKQPDMPRTVLHDDWEKYRNELNNYFVEKVKDNERLNNYELDIYFYPYIPVETNGQSVPFDYMNDLAKVLPRKEYDMILLDERILFNDIALMESERIFKETKFRQPSLELLHDLTKYINKDDLEFHDPKILSYGMYKKKIYGIPFEYDFDVLYYHKDGENSNANGSDTMALVENMKDFTWESLLEKMEKNSQPFVLALGDDNDVLNFVIEYTNNIHTLSPEYNPDYIKIFYDDEESTDFYTKFRDLVKSFSPNNEPIKAARTSLDDAYSSFLTKNSTFFKAKASHNFLFKSKYGNDGIPLSLPPKYQSATTNKYLVANKYSDIKPDLLAEVALILTDKEAQLFRAEKYGSIPTFDFTKKDSDQDLQDYCNNNPVICDAMDKVEKLYIRDIFSSDTMVPFYEILCFIPIRFKNFFITNDIKYIEFSLKNVNEFITDNLGVYGVLSIILTILVIVFCCFVIYMTYKLKEHPYIKVISPIFCNLIVIGCILNTIKVLKFIPPYSRGKIKIFLILETIGTNLIYIPMFAVAYRIFRIYKTKSFMSNSLNNKRLFICVIVTISLSVIYKSVIAIFCRLYYESVGSVRYARIPIGYYTNHETLDKIYQVYLTIIFISLLFMIIATGSRSKKFGDVCYTFVIFGTNISDFLVERLITRLDGKEYYPLYFFVTVFFNCLLHFICVYILVGSRIHLLINNPNFDFVSSSNGTTNASDASQYVALRSRIRSMSIVKRYSSMISTKNSGYSQTKSGSTIR
ncbi:hypothetical protein BCR36DRAFT_327504 [Piromyces finnis]|uniref:G-protein coupled receptors family 3 profile domain-containing protein n=1 Tax=Piromyces finnis TaxID=1754191 RepID=A0A1Y1V924_9FUNG|nr:hypothetical protein BCR36DRAFT_327504 [Piromyces finnis]|eukprot:ORX50028.1 hypothetical protein BCR36DRAFT_327504 [Piromyces finnis]